LFRHIENASIFRLGRRRLRLGHRLDSVDERALLPHRRD